MLDQTMLSDYMLDLLPVAERQAVEDHAAVCATCRSALQAERRLAHNVRHTVAALPQPDFGRLMALQPPISYRKTAVPAAWRGVIARSGVLSLYGIQQAAVAFAMAIFLGVGLLGINGLGSGMVEASPVPAIAATTTVTQEPTAVATATQLAMYNFEIQATATPEVVVHVMP